MSEENRPLRLLSLDGGGIRGLSSLYILQHLLVTVQRQDGRGPVPSGDMPSPRACDYFDMIAGTSTGGLIAVMLGVLRMDIQTCIKAYVDMAPEIFPTEGLISGSRFGHFTKLWKGTQRFDPAPFEANIKTLVKKHLGDGATGEEMMHSQPDQGCKVFVCVNSEQPRFPFKFRSYDNPQYMTRGVAIWEACRATSAAPTYFPPISIGDPAQNFVDGGLGYNNPTMVLWNEAIQLWPSRNISCVVSIGTGILNLRDVGATIKPLFETLQDMATDTEVTARDVKGMLEQRFSNQDIYFRFNVQQGLGVVGMEEWKEMHRVRTVTEAYLNDNHRQVKNCADQIYSPNTLISPGPVPKTLKSFSTIPFPRDPGFVGREEILAQLESEFANVKSQRWASLYGLGGIGKSQIAIEYSYRQKERSAETSTFWVHASSKARFEQSYAEIAAAVGILAVGDGKADVLHLVSDWLADKDNGPWLLILDNADDESFLLEPLETDHLVRVKPARRRLLDYVPRVGHGTVLITSRDRNCALKLAGFHGTPTEVTYMTPVESVALLRKTLQGALQEESSELVNELGNVPLAISQASAYIKMVPPFSILSYLETFRRSDKNQAALLKEDEGDLKRDPGVPNAVITSWELSFYQIREKAPRSAGLLSLMSYLNRQAIPQFLIQGHVDEILFRKDLAPLLGFSLIRAEIGENSFEMHRLVQTAVRHWLQSEGYDQLWKERAIERVAAQFPASECQAQHWPICEDLMSHADEVLLYVENSKDMSLEHADLLIATAWYLCDRKGQYGLAQKRATLALEALKHHFDDDDADKVLDASATLAYAKSGLGQLDEARHLEESILKHKLKKNLGPEHPGTLNTMHNLALSYSRLGLYEKAEKQFKHVVEVEERVLGNEHPDFLTSASLLAHVQNEMGKYEEAEKQSARVLEISRRCLGTKSVITLNAWYYLSVALTRQEKFKKAESEIVPIIPISEKVFGPSQRKTLDCRTLLAEIYMGQEKLNDAEEICMLCFDTAKEVYGPQNKTTLNIMNLLALVCGAQGKSEAALGLFESALESVKLVHGPDHPQTLTFMHNIACCYYDKGNINHAIQLMSEVLEKKREVLPANHPYTINSAKWLARWKAEENEIEEWETEEEWIGDAWSEENGSKEDENEEDASEEEVSPEEESDEDESEGEESQDNVGDENEIDGQRMGTPQNSSLALRNRYQEDGQRSDTA